MRVPTPVSFAASIALLAPFAIFAPAATAQDQMWITQFGTSVFDRAFALAPDGAGGVMVAGGTKGNLGGPGAGLIDVFLARYDSSGNQLWITQFGTTGDEYSNALAPDGAGGVMVAGSTRRSLGGPFLGQTDAFLARYDSAGNQLWITQFGTSELDDATCLAPDGAGGVMVAGWTRGSLGGPNTSGANDVFLARYDSAGNQTWIRQFGTDESERPTALAPDGVGGVMVAGHTQGSLGGTNAGENDAFLSRYDSSGNQLWIRQFGTGSDDNANALAPDGAGGVMVAGHTWGSLGGANAGRRDAFVARYDSAGNQIWIRQFGTSTFDIANALAPDGAGGVIVVGGTEGNLGGPSAGGIFLARYDSAGDQLWIRQFGTGEDENAGELANDGVGGVMVTGWTFGSLGGPNAGGSDAFLARYSIDSCYADCDQSTGVSVLDVFDFLCFQNGFVLSAPYACGCDSTTGHGVCDIFDFLCFQNAFVGGCK